MSGIITKIHEINEFPINHFMFQQLKKINNDELYWNVLDMDNIYLKGRKEKFEFNAAYSLERKELIKESECNIYRITPKGKSLINYYEVACDVSSDDVSLLQVADRHKIFYDGEICRIHDESWHRVYPDRCQMPILKNLLKMGFLQMIEDLNVYGITPKAKKIFPYLVFTEFERV